MPGMALPVGENTVSNMAMAIPRRRALALVELTIEGETYINKTYCNEKCESSSWMFLRGGKQQYKNEQ